MTGSDHFRSPAKDTGTDNTARIRSLNDTFRRTFLGGKVMLTSGIRDHARDNLSYLLMEVRQFSAFDVKNDPHDEHDFGAFEWDGETVFWKIDYHDADLTMGSPDPSEPAVTTRVLTVMLAWEY